MATEQAAQWAEASGQDAMACIAENTLQAAATAIERAGGGMTARRIAQGARGWAARTSSITRSTLRRLQGLTQRPAREQVRPAHTRDVDARGVAREPDVDGRGAAREPTLEERFAPEPALALATPWLAGAAGAWLVHVSTSSWSQAALAGTCLFALATLSAMRSSQRREALALREQLSELRLSLRVTQALLDVEMVADAEHLEDELDDGRESGARRVPRQRLSRPQLG
jgi:hypothetical protein